MRIFTSLFLLLLAMILTSCQNREQPAPVVGYKVKLSYVPEVHTVRSGDSLYAIAWQYDLDYRTIAAYNGLSGSEPIYPGQKLYLQAEDPELQRLAQYRQKQQAIKKHPPKSSNSYNAKATSQVGSLQQAQKSIQLSRHWLRPSSGEIITQFSKNKEGFNKGIDFSGQLNDKVVAAQSGKVVYSGAGLRGYGRLIIIKHNDSYLSAYAHNNELLVKEGDVVHQGQAIAKMGKTDSNQVKLHFQIRKNGQPVDPARYFHS